ncbi:CsbD family protein [Chitinimonas naiadis]
MDWEMVEGNWQSYKPKVRAQWRHLTEEALDSIAGRRTALGRRLQEAYCISYAEAEREIRHFEEINLANWPRNIN